MKYGSGFLLLAGSSLLGLSIPAAAQEVSNGDPQVATGDIPDIVVTAQRRSESVQRTPLSITALTGDDLQGRQITSLEQLGSAVPNVNIGTLAGGAARVSIRGVGFDQMAVGQEPRIAYHTDGIYVSRPAAQGATFFDIERIEVVRGPQGSLYGRNATGGAINVITADPTDRLSGYFHQTVGNYSLFREEGAIGGPLGEGTGIRLAFVREDRDGYGENATTGNEVDNRHFLAMRSKLKSKLTDSFDIQLSADYSHIDDRSGVSHYIGRASDTAVPTPLLLGSAMAGRRDLLGEDAKSDQTHWGVGGTLEWRVGDVSITSVTGYRKSELDRVQDYDWSALQIADIILSERNRQFSQEVRFSGKLGDIDWLVGGFYINDRLAAQTAIPVNRIALGAPALFTSGIRFGGTLDTKAYALFGQARVPITDSLTLTLGGRYSDEHRSIVEYSAVDFSTAFDPAAPLPPLQPERKESWSSFTPRVSLDWQVAPRVFAYAQYAKGFKSGTFAIGSLTPAVRPELLDDYEAGLKADWFGGRLRTNVSAFYYDYTNLQVQQLLPGGVNYILSNAASARTLGVEFESIASVGPLKLELNATLLDAKYRSFRTIDAVRANLGALDLSGNHLTQSPPYTVTAAAEYRQPLASGEIMLRGEAFWSGKVYYTPFEDADPNTSQRPYSLFNASLRYTGSSGTWSAQAFVRNIANKEVVSFSAPSSALFGFPAIGFLAPPRTYGLQLNFDF